jgi:8-amino-7-oxononanoate synthase
MLIPPVLRRMLSSSSSAVFATATTNMKERMAEALRKRGSKGNLRSLRPQPSAVDFSSNDYLGLARDPRQRQAVEAAYHLMMTKSSSSSLPLGATGSRLLSGDHDFTHELESYLAQIHGVSAALLFNSGYDANLSVVSCLACDVVIYDELIHNSLHMGLRLWQSASSSSPPSTTATSTIAASNDNAGTTTATTTTTRLAVPFRHNNVEDLRSILREKHRHDARTTVAVLLESVYSMDGDEAPISDVLDVAHEYGAVVVCDEAHGLGVMGSTNTGALAPYMNHPALAFAIYTFGKAAGGHGALVCCPMGTTARDYLVNYAYPFIYSTALPPHALAVIRAAYETLTSRRGNDLRTALRDRIAEFKTAMRPILQRYEDEDGDVYLVPSDTPIQALVVPGNILCTQLCDMVYDRSGIRLFPIRAPTVTVERVRIVLHAHNTADQVQRLVAVLGEALEQVYATKNPRPKL